MSSRAENRDGILAITNVEIGEDAITVALSDGRKISAPLARFPRLIQATTNQLQRFEISPARYGIHWPDLDEDISIKAFVG